MPNLAQHLLSISHPIKTQTECIMRLRSANRRKPIRVLRPSGPAATRSTPANISGLGMQPRGQQLPATLLSKSWSTSHIAHTSSTDRFTSQAGSAGFAASRGDQAVGQLLMPKTEEGMHQAPQLPAPGGQDQQQPGGELITDFSRALVESLHRDDEQQPQQQEEPLQAAAPDADADAEDEHPAMQDADSSPLAPARRGPRGTSSRYRGVTRHRCGPCRALWQPLKAHREGCVPRAPATSPCHAAVEQGSGLLDYQALHLQGPRITYPCCRFHTAWPV